MGALLHVCSLHCPGQLHLYGSPVPRPHAQLLLSQRQCRVLQFVYDIWFGQLSPAHEFPSLVRGVLNRAFGELAARARRMDLRDVLLLCVSLCLVNDQPWLKL